MAGVLIANVSRVAVAGLIGAAALFALLWNLAALRDMMSRSTVLSLVSARRLLPALGIIAAVPILAMMLYNANPESSRGRLMIWKIALPAALDNPWTGVGHGKFGYHYLEYQSAYFKDPGNSYDTHKAVALHVEGHDYSPSRAMSIPHLRATSVPHPGS